ncbi:hypothetical protein OPV22_030070 [Ensete ventricosum]|uniref:Uncharacterized protein n=1 Tax=Ensete ventricosum TaxID=4639 RepID=A0AAV8QB04_ENSVE|nr:hypothetical protein OPV22_030070 [Ensete ventricosum]
MLPPGFTFHPTDQDLAAGGSITCLSPATPSRKPTSPPRKRGTPVNVVCDNGAEVTVGYKRNLSFYHGKVKKYTRFVMDEYELCAPPCDNNGTKDQKVLCVIVQWEAGSEPPLPFLDVVGDGSQVDRRCSHNLISLCVDFSSFLLFLLLKILV